MARIAVSDLYWSDKPRIRVNWWVILIHLLPTRTIGSPPAVKGPFRAPQSTDHKSTEDRTRPSAPLQMSLTKENMVAMNMDVTPEELRTRRTAALLNVQFGESASSILWSQSAPRDILSRRHRQHLNIAKKMAARPDVSVPAGATDQPLSYAVQRHTEEKARARQDGQDFNRRLGRLNRQAVKRVDKKARVAKNQRSTPRPADEKNRLPSQPCYPSSIQYRPNKHPKRR